MEESFARVYWAWQNAVRANEELFSRYHLKVPNPKSHSKSTSFLALVGKAQFMLFPVVRCFPDL